MCSHVTKAWRLFNSSPSPLAHNPHCILPSPLFCHCSLPSPVTGWAAQSPEFGPRDVVSLTWAPLLIPPPSRLAAQIRPFLEPNFPRRWLASDVGVDVRPGQPGTRIYVRCTPICEMYNCTGRCTNNPVRQLESTRLVTNCPVSYRAGLLLIIRKITLLGKWPAPFSNGLIGQATGRPIGEPSRSENAPLRLRFKLALGFSGAGQDNRKETEWARPTTGLQGAH